MDCRELSSYLQQEQHRFRSDRTREAMAAAKARGVKFGGLNPGTIARNNQLKDAALAEAEEMRPWLGPLHSRGASLREMADSLAWAGFTTRSGKPFAPTHVKRQLQRLGLCS